MIFRDPLLQTNISKQPFRPSLLRAHDKSSRRFDVTEHDPPLPSREFFSRLLERNRDSI
jgi:hypothetical protein